MNGPVAEGGSAARQATLRIPDGDAAVGNLQVTVTANATGTLAEGNASNTAGANNTASTTVTAGLAPYPDLAVSGVTAPAVTVGDPATVTVGWTVTNAGTAAAAGAWADRVVATPVAGGPEVVLRSFDHTGPLAPQAGYTRSETFLLPPAFQGRYHPSVRTNATGTVFENARTANNTAEAGNLFDVTPTPYADLVVSAATAPAAGASGRPLTVSWTVTNQGIGTTSSERWGDNLSLATDPQGQHVVAALGRFGHTGPLAPGGSYSRSAEVALPNGISGPYYVVVDTAGPYEFLYTGNNRGAAGPVAVALTDAPDLLVTQAGTAATAPSGSSVDVTWTVKNLGPGDAPGRGRTRSACRRSAGPAG